MNALTAAFCAYDKPGIVGGTSSWIEWLLPELRQHGINPRALIFLHTGERGPVTESLERHGVECTIAPFPASLEKRIRWIIKELRANPCDVFVPNEVPAAYYAARWIRKSGIPTVGVLHAYGPATLAMQAMFINGRKSFALSGVVAVSKELERQTVATRPRHTWVRRIPCGADVPEIRTSPPTGLFRMAYVGRLAEEDKRVLRVTRAFIRAATEIDKVEATIFGDGPEREEVEFLLQSEGGSVPVSWGGSLRAHQIQEELLRTHAIVLLSDREGLPVSLMEAMACGCVPVCLRIPSGIPELVEDGVTGLLIDDVGSEFVNAIRRLVGDASLWQRLSFASRQTIATGYSHPACAAAWSKVLRESARAEKSVGRVRVPWALRLPVAVPPFESRSPYGNPLLSIARIMNRARVGLGRYKQILFKQSVQ